jgi:hypothetical protein
LGSKQRSGTHMTWVRVLAGMVGAGRGQTPVSSTLTWVTNPGARLAGVTQGYSPGRVWLGYLELEPSNELNKGELGWLAWVVAGVKQVGSKRKSRLGQ